MNLKVTLHSTDVSFNRVQIREIPGSASGIYGYFTNSSAADLYHNPPDWGQVGAENNTPDHAWWQDAEPPWYEGGFQWFIPVEWRVVGSTNAGTLPNRVQTISITDTNGTTTINKLERSVTRTP